MDNTNKSKDTPVDTSTVPSATPPPITPATSTTDILSSVATPSTPVVAEPVAPTATTAGSSVAPGASTVTDTPMSEAQAGISPPPVIPPVTTAESNVTDPGYAKTKSNHMVLIIVILVVVAFASVLVMFFYRQYSYLMSPSAKTISPTPQVQAIVSPTALPSPTPENPEEADLQSLKFDDVDTELKNIDKDISQL